MVKLFVVGFPRDMQESELAGFFAEYGTVEKTLIITDPETGQSKGYGFIDMQDLTSAQAAIAALDGASIDERTISVRIKEEKEPKAAAPAPAAPKKKRPRR